jgi:hypothetical protein
MPNAQPLTVDLTKPYLLSVAAVLCHLPQLDVEERYADYEPKNFNPDLSQWRGGGQIQVCVCESVRRRSSTQEAARVCILGTA